MSVQGRAVPLVHSTTRPLALGGRLLLLGDVSACTPACRLTQQLAGPHGLSRLLLLTAAVPPSLTRARTRGHAAAGALPVAPLPMLPSTAMLTRGEAHACLKQERLRKCPGHMARGGPHPWPCEDSGALLEILQGYLNAGGSQVGVDGNFHRGGLSLF